MHVNAKSHDRAQGTTRTDEPHLIRHGGRVVLQGTKGDDDVQVSRAADGGYLLKVNDQSFSLSSDELRKLVVRTGNGDDKVVLDPNLHLNVTVRGGRGNDSIVNGVTPDGFEAVGKRAGANKFTGGAERPKRVVLNGGAGDDTITSNGDGVRIHGGRGADTLEVTGNGNRVHGQGGADQICVDGNDNRVGGGRGADRMGVTGDHNLVRGRRGADTIDVQGNGNRVGGGRGKDQLTVQGNDNTVGGGAGRDDVTVDGDRNHVRTHGRDQLHVGGANNFVRPLRA